MNWSQPVTFGEVVAALGIFYALRVLDIFVAEALKARTERKRQAKLAAAPAGARPQYGPGPHDQCRHPWHGPR